MVSASQRYALRGIVAATAGPGMLDEYALYVSRLLTPKDFLERLKQLIGS